MTYFHVATLEHLPQRQWTAGLTSSARATLSKWQARHLLLSLVTTFYQQNLHRHLVVISQSSGVLDEIYLCIDVTQPSVVQAFHGSHL